MSQNQSKSKASATVDDADFHPGDIVFSDEDETEDEEAQAAKAEDEKKWLDAALLLGWEEIKEKKLVFGKHSGTTYADMIKSRARRDYLRYLHSWDKLHKDTAHFIMVALDHYGAQSQERRGKKRVRTE